MKNNKGFSLVELIIVIAIMAILVGVMAPQLIRYIEKTKESSDTQLLDTVRSAITTAILDPTVATASNVTIAGSGTLSSYMDGTGVLNVAIQDTLGYTTASAVQANLKSKAAFHNNTNGTINVTVINGNQVVVTCGDLSVGNASAGGSGSQAASSN